MSKDKDCFFSYFNNIIAGLVFKFKLCWCFSP